MKKNISLTFIFIVSFVLFSCGKAKSNEIVDKKDSVLVPPPIPIEEPKTVQLKCISKGEDEYGSPQNDVVLSIDGKDSVIAKTLACEDITNADYKRLDIPSEATTACGGWWAGGGDYYYAYIEDGKVKVFHGWQDEGQNDDGFHWEEMVMGKKGK